MSYQNHFSGMFKKEIISIYIKLLNLLNNFKIKNLTSQKPISQGHLATFLHPELEIVYAWISDLQAADNCSQHPPPRTRAGFLWRKSITL